MQTDASKKKNIFNKIFKKKLEAEINLLHEDDENKPLPNKPVEQKEEEEAIIFTPDEDTMEMDFSEEEEKEGGELDNEEKEVQKTQNPYEEQEVEE